MAWPARHRAQRSSKSLPTGGRLDCSSSRFPPPLGKLPVHLRQARLLRRTASCECSSLDAGLAAAFPEEPLSKCVTQCHQPRTSTGLGWACTDCQGESAGGTVGAAVTGGVDLQGSRVNVPLCNAPLEAGSHKAQGGTRPLAWQRRNAGDARKSGPRRGWHAHRITAWQARQPAEWTLATAGRQTPPTAALGS